MPSCTGKTRRPNVGKGHTRTTSLSFTVMDYDWVFEQSQARRVSMSLVVAECIALYRETQLTEMAALEKEERKAKRAAQPEAPVAPVEL